MRQSYIFQSGWTGRGSFLSPVCRQCGLPYLLWINHAFRALTAGARSCTCLHDMSEGRVISHLGSWGQRVHMGMSICVATTGLQSASRVSRTQRATVLMCVQVCTVCLSTWPVLWAPGQWPTCPSPAQITHSTMAHTTLNYLLMNYSCGGESLGQGC